MDALQPEVLIPVTVPLSSALRLPTGFRGFSQAPWRFRQLVLTAGQRSQLGCQFGCGGGVEVAGFPSNPHLIELASIPSPASADIEAVRARVHAQCV
jgi:hypothetical protein